MAGIGNKKQANGKYRAWYTGFKSGKKARIFFVGTASKIETLRIGQKLEDDHRQVILGYREAPSASQQHKTTPFADVVAEYIEWGEAQGGRNGFPWSKHHANRIHLMLESFWPERLQLEVMGDLWGKLADAERVIREEQIHRKSGKTIKLDVSVLNAFCNWCIERDYLSENPLKKLGKIQAVPRSVRRAVTSDELKRVIHMLVANDEDFGHWLMLLPFSCCTGLRSGTIKALTVHDLDKVKCELHLSAASAKNRKEGHKAVAEELVEMLWDNYQSGMPSMLYEKYYTRIDASQQPPKNALLYVPSHPARELDKILQFAGVEKSTHEGKIDFHALRVAYATFVIEAGASLKEAQTALDHSDPRITANLYAKTRDERMHTLAEQVAKPVLDMMKRAHSVQESKNGGAKKSRNPFETKELRQKIIGGGNDPVLQPTLSLKSVIIHYLPMH